MSRHRLVLFGDTTAVLAGEGRAVALVFGSDKESETRARLLEREAEVYALLLDVYRLSAIPQLRERARELVDYAATGQTVPAAKPVPVTEIPRGEHAT